MVHTNKLTYMILLKKIRVKMIKQILLPTQTVTLTLATTPTPTPIKNKI